MDTPNGDLVRRRFRTLIAKKIGLTRIHVRVANRPFGCRLTAFVDLRIGLQCESRCDLIATSLQERSLDERLNALHRTAGCH